MLLQASHRASSASVSRWDRILTISRGRELTTGREAVRHETLEEDRVEVGTGKVNGSSMTSRSRANDDLHVEPSKDGFRRSQWLLLTTFECILLLRGTIALPFMGAIFSVFGIDVDSKRVW